MPIIYAERVFRTNLQDNKDTLYIYSDTMVEEGDLPGAKEMRGERNSIGLPVKYTPDSGRESYYRNESFVQVKKFIDIPLKKAEQHLQTGGTVVMLSNKFECRRSKMKERSPVIFEYIQKRLKKLETI